MKSAIECVTKNYCNFNGRANRKEFWLFYLMSVFFSLTLDLSYLPLLSLFSGWGTFRVVVIILINIAHLALIIPGLAVGVRRLHDTNRSGWFLFVSLIPLVGLIWFIVVLCLKGTKDENKYSQVDIN